MVSSSLPGAPVVLVLRLLPLPLPPHPFERVGSKVKGTET